MANKETADYILGINQYELERLGFQHGVWKEVTDKAKPTIMPLLNDSFARELKNELKNGSIKWFYPPKRLKRA